MRCEVVAVGTELLLGQVVDSNSAHIGDQLALAGIDCHFHTKVGDNCQRIASVLRIALDRNDAVIVCGGLGPTSDDISREAIAEVPEITEMDLNPVKVLAPGEGVVVVDARVRVKPLAPTERPELADLPSVK